MEKEGGKELLYRVAHYLLNINLLNLLLVRKAVPMQRLREIGRLKTWVPEKLLKIMQLILLASKISFYCKSEKNDRAVVHYIYLCKIIKLSNIDLL